MGIIRRFFSLEYTYPVLVKVLVALEGICLVCSCHPVIRVCLIRTQRKDRLKRIKSIQAS